MSSSAPRPKRRRPDRARRVAFDALRQVNGDGGYANLILPALLTERGIDGRDAAFATELLAGTCRGQGTYDVIIAAAGRRELSTLQPAVVDLLRLGTHQILAMRVPARAAVAATVDLAAATVGERVSGVTNAVLRRVAEHDEDEWLARLGGDLDGHDRLALETAHPRWIVDAYAAVLSVDQLRAALDADNLSPPVTLAVRPGLAETAELLAAGADPGRHTPWAARWTGNPADLAAVREGRAGVQDEGSQLVVLGLTRAVAAPGPWLDLCAGPGGKSALLAGLAAADGSTVLAAELAPHRATLVAQAVRAYEAAAPTVVIADGRQPAWRPGSFTRVLADVPCTGLGALRRRPEARWRRDPAEVEQLHPLQLDLLATAIDSAAVGGIVGYVTCSPHRRETVDVVAETVADRHDIEIVPAASLFPESLSPGLSDAIVSPYLQLWPHRHGTDAMFAAYLRRTG